MRDPASVVTHRHPRRGRVVSQSHRLGGGAAHGPVGVIQAGLAQYRIDRIATRVVQAQLNGGVEALHHVALNVAGTPYFPGHVSAWPLNVLDQGAAEVTILVHAEVDDDRLYLWIYLYC